MILTNKQKVNKQNFFFGNTNKIKMQMLDSPETWKISVEERTKHNAQFSQLNPLNGVLLTGIYIKIYIFKELQNVHHKLIRSFDSKDRINFHLIFKNCRYV